jgi:hypothetical protein
MIIDAGAHFPEGLCLVGAAMSRGKQEGEPCK